MARIVKEEEYAIKRNEILDVAQQLVFTKGFEQMSIQDILDELHISKGAFYHYFDSKVALLDGLMDHMMDDAEGLLRPIVEDKNLPAIEKIQRFFSAGSRWKTDRKSFMLDLLRVWYTDANALVRQKQEATYLQRLAPMLAQIVHQGIAEGTMKTAFPDQVSGMLWGLAQGIEDDIAELLLADPPPGDALQRLESIMGAYAEAIERILGAPAGSLPLADVDLLKEWITEPAGEKRA
jgi:AcrR family transcriptional regulator